MQAPRVCIRRDVRASCEQRLRCRRQQQREPQLRRRRHRQWSGGGGYYDADPVPNDGYYDADPVPNNDSADYATPLDDDDVAREARNLLMITVEPQPRRNSTSSGRVRLLLAQYFLHIKK